MRTTQQSRLAEYPSMRERPSGRRSFRVRRSVAAATAAVMGMGLLAGCSSGQSGEVLGAVFGLEGAPVRPYRVGKIPAPVVRPQDVVIGTAANRPGQCIYRRAVGQRFRAQCPAGYDLKSR